MFEVKKSDMYVESFINYPITTAQAKQFICINGTTTYLFDGNSKVKGDEGDIFESVFGKELAETNAIIDMMKQYKKYLISLTKQPEWRKEKKEEEKAKSVHVIGPDDRVFGSEHVNIFNNNSKETIKVTVEVL